MENDAITEGFASSETFRYGVSKPNIMQIIKIILGCLCLLLSIQITAQTQIQGKVTDTNGEPLIGANIRLKNGVIGTVTDADGNFDLRLKNLPPVVLVCSFIGYESQKISIQKTDNQISIKLIEASNLLAGDEIIVSASRVKESILESPTSIERMDILQIKHTASPNFYDALINLKGVDMSTQSLTFKSLNTRGFGGNANTRFLQIIDRMDNQAPGLNFAVGNMVGISEMDLESVELVQGASSALYGAGAINGVLLMTSKNPFDYQGFSGYFKLGVLHLNSSQTNIQPMYDVGVRYAKSWKNKLAIKLNFSYLEAEDWHASDFRNRNDIDNPTSSRDTDLNYNGVNIYGDEVSANLQSSAQQLASLGFFPISNLPLIPDIEVSRTGYAERHLVDYSTNNLKLNASLHYRFSDKIEGILQVNYGTGTSVYTGFNRFSLKNLRMTQIKAELRSPNFFIKAYTSQESSGDSYDAVFTALAINNEWSNNLAWFTEYVQAFGEAKSNQLNDNQAHHEARSFADRNRYLPNTEAFEQAKNRATLRTINAGLNGARFDDSTDLYHLEGMYNFREIWNPEQLEMIVGGNYRLFDLNSNDTIFPDADKNITISEYGFYTQISRRFWDKKIKVLASGRYDKNENFEGRFTPRLALVYTAGKSRNHHFRASYQTGFRNPTTQGQYLDLDLGNAGHLLGGLPAVQAPHSMLSI